MAGAQTARDAWRRRLGGRVAVLVAFAVVAAAAAWGIDHSPLARDDGSAVAIDWSSPRVEYWRDVAVDVPDAWGYGGAPTSASGQPVVCDPRPARDPAGRRVPLGAGTAPPGYVGRPLVLSGECLAYPLPSDPDDLAELGAATPDGSRLPYVWLGGDVPVGTVDLGDGFVQETEEWRGVPVTVGSADQDTRARVIGSIRAVRSCAPRLPAGRDFPRTRYGRVGADARAAVSLRVCSYVESGTGSDAAGGEVGLAWAVELGSSGLSDYREALRGLGSRASCALPSDEHEWVVLEFVDAGGATLRRDVAHTTCGVLETNAARLRLTGDGSGARAYDDTLSRTWTTGPASALRAVLPSLVAPEAQDPAEPDR